MSYVLHIYTAPESRLNHIHLSACWTSLGRLARAKAARASAALKGDDGMGRKGPTWWAHSVAKLVRETLHLIKKILLGGLFVVRYSKITLFQKGPQALNAYQALPSV